MDGQTDSHSGYSVHLGVVQYDRLREQTKQVGMLPFEDRGVLKNSMWNLVGNAY